MKIIIPVPLVYFLAASVAYLLHFYFPMTAFDPAGWLRVVIIILFISCTLVMLWALLTMLAAKTSPNPYLTPQHLTANGPYHYSRNPMYLAISGLYLAFALFINSVWFFLFFIPAIILIKYAVILREEVYLDKRFGQQYRDYKKRVRRWL